MTRHALALLEEPFSCRRSARGRSSGPCASPRRRKGGTWKPTCREAPRPGPVRAFEMIFWSVTQRGKHPRLAAGCMTHHRPGRKASIAAYASAGSCGGRAGPGWTRCVPAKPTRPGAQPGRWGKGAGALLSAGPASGTAGLCHGCRAPGTQTGCGRGRSPKPDPGEEEVSGQGICGGRGGSGGGLG